MENINPVCSVWFEKYAPQKIEDEILPTSFKNRLLECIKTQRIPNFGFWSSRPGLGKSSTAKALIKSLEADSMFVNASLEKGIDVIRSKILNFASQESIFDKPKIIVMDEADHITKDAQAAFRGFIDEFSSNCTFIFTGNYKSKMIEPLLDRLENYDFAEFNKTEMVKPIFNRLIYILESENIDVTQEIKVNLGNIIKSYYPCIRSMISSLQRSVGNGKFEYVPEASNFDDVIAEMKKKNYLELVQKVNTLNNPDSMYEYLYSNIDMFSNQANAIIQIADYQYKSEQVRDKNLNLSACLVQLSNCL